MISPRGFIVGGAKRAKQEEQKSLKAQGPEERQGLSTPVACKCSTVAHRHKRCSISSGAYCGVPVSGRSRQQTTMYEKDTTEFAVGTDSSKDKQSLVYAVSRENLPRNENETRLSQDGSGANSLVYIVSPFLGKVMLRSTRTRSPTRPNVRPTYSRIRETMLTSGITHPPYCDYLVSRPMKRVKRTPVSFTRRWSAW